MKIIIWVVLGCITNYLLSYYDCLTGKNSKTFEYTIALKTLIIECIVGTIAFLLFRYSGNTINEIGGFIIGATAIETMKVLIKKIKIEDGELPVDLNSKG